MVMGICQVGVFVLCIYSALGIGVMYERMDQVVDSDFMESDLRIKKYNRTIAAMSGTITMLKDLDNEYEASIDFFHSPMGNNQFNKYAMKIPLKPICNLLSEDYKDYRSFLAESIDNLPEVSDCPLKTGQLNITNYILDANMFPSYLNPGLWRAEFFVRPIGDEERQATIKCLFRIYPDGWK